MSVPNAGRVSLNGEQARVRTDAKKDAGQTGKAQKTEGYGKATQSKVSDVLSCQGKEGCDGSEGSEGSEGCEIQDKSFMTRMSERFDLQNKGFVGGPLNV